MPNLESPANRQNKHRQNLRLSGLRPVQFWVPDTRRLDFAAALVTQCQNLNNSPTEDEVLNFTQTAANTIEGWQS